MSKFRCQITMTLDGCVAGPNLSLDKPMGEGVEQLHDWVVKTQFFLQMHGMPGEGETGINNDLIREAFANLGATIMGRHMFGPLGGAWDESAWLAWRGWWGENPPYHTPVYVLTHHAREPLVMQGGTTFYFVTDGIESALRQARDAAGDKDIMLGGGAKAIQQYLAAGLLDEIDIHLVPLLLPGGIRLFDNLAGSDVRLELLSTLPATGVSHLKYRIQH